MRRGGFRGDKKEGGADKASASHTRDKSKRKAPEQQHEDTVDEAGGDEAEEKPWKKRRTEEMNVRGRSFTSYYFCIID